MLGWWAAVGAAGAVYFGLCGGAVGAGAGDGAAAAGGAGDDGGGVGFGVGVVGVTGGVFIDAAESVFLGGAFGPGILFVDFIVDAGVEADVFLSGGFGAFEVKAADVFGAFVFRVTGGRVAVVAFDVGSSC